MNISAVLTRDAVAVSPTACTQHLRGSDAEDEACGCVAGHAHDPVRHPCPRGTDCRCARPIGHPVPFPVNATLCDDARRRGQEVVRGVRPR
jgi:hypothetical protein